ncbi:hypothetical protein L2D01_12905 [Hyphomonadaceae bacterium ML37]|nr:hypothetical protein L2D01_12905 [Hyphomonadaceae bacterium ML37]
MRPLHLECIVYGRPGLIVHVGAGPDGPGALAQSARAAILIEPDPDRAEQLRIRYGATPSVRLIEGAVTRAAGRMPWRRAHAFTHAMGAAGAQGLVRDLAAAIERDADCVVDCIAADSILKPDDFDGEGEHILLIDAADDAVDVLDALDAAGWLARFDHVIVRVKEAPPPGHAKARGDVADWAQARRWLMLALPGQGGADAWRAWIGPVRKPASGAGPEQNRPAPHAARVVELDAALETYRAATRDAEARWLEQRAGLMDELRASQARCAGLEADGELEAVRRAAAESEAHSQARREELVAELEAARVRALELGRALQTAEAARASAEAQLQSARQPARDRDGYQSALREDAVRFQRELDRHLEAARAASERERALTAQITAARDDLRLAIKGQRLAQASLSELQDRYSALLDDRNALDGLLRQLTDRLTSAATARLGIARSGAQADWDH